MLSLIREAIYKAEVQSRCLASENFYLEVPERLWHNLGRLLHNTVESSSLETSIFGFKVEVKSKAKHITMKALPHVGPGFEQALNIVNEELKCLD